MPHKARNMKISVYIATSLDGYIARENGELDWLPGSDGESVGDDYGYHEFVDSIDVLIMGRNTYETVMTFGQWPYGEKRVIIMSSKAIQIPEHLSRTVESSSSSPKKLVEELSKSGVDHLYVDGGKTIQSFLKEGLIQQIIITTVPVLIGKGILLFGQFDRDIKLRHIETNAFENGYVQSRYEVLE